MGRRRSELRRRLVGVVLAGAVGMQVLAASASAAPSDGDGDGDGAGAGAGAYVVTVADGVDAVAVARAVGAEADLTYSAVLNGFAADLTAAQVSTLRADTRVAAVDEDKATPAFRDRPAPFPPDYSLPFTSWGQDRMGLMQSPTAKVDGVDRKQDRVDADIAVLDTGVSVPFPDLNLAGGLNCLKGGPRNDYADREGHGTLVAGLIGALDNPYGAVGVAPGARIWAIRVVNENGEITTSAALCGMEWVAKNARRIDVVNLSWGGEGTDTGNCGRKRPGVPRDSVHQAICRVIKMGVTVVAAAGNEASDAAGFTPAAYPELITVSAFTETDGLPGGFGGSPWCDPEQFDDHIASFSNFGAGIDFAAPGVCLTNLGINANPGEYLGVGSGTSFSAPMVAGAAALVRARRPWASPAEVRRRLLAAAEHAPLIGDPDGIAEPIINVSTL